MIFDICLYKFCSGKLSQYPALEYAKDVISESRKLTFSLHGKRQLSLVKRGVSGNVLLYNIYNYIYNENDDSIGICIVFHDKYPYDIDFLFKFCGLIVAEIIEEGKAFHFDSKGNIISDNNDLEFHHSTLSKYKDKIKATLQNVKSKTRAIPRNVYNNFEDQHAICQLSDKSWSLDEIFKTNNVVIITEEIEEENINSMRSFIKKSNETVEDLNKRIKKLEEQLRKAEKEKKQSQTNPPKKQSNNTNGTGMDTTAWITLGVIGAIILLNVIAPWFIPSVWPKLAVVFTGLGTYVVIKALDDNSNKKIYEILGWSGAIAILLSTVLTIYGLCGGFSPDTVEENRNIEKPMIKSDTDSFIQKRIVEVPIATQDRPSNKSGVEFMTDIAKDLISSYCNAVTNNKISVLRELYAYKINRFHSKYNTTIDYVIDTHKRYDKEFGVKRRYFDIQWETLKVGKTYNDEATTISIVMYYRIDRHDSTKKTFFVLRKHFVLNNNNKIVEEYDDKIDSR